MKNKNNLRIVITLILLLVVSCIAGFICGRLVAHAKEMGSVDNTIQTVKNIIKQSFPVVFIIVSILGVVVQIIAFGQCNLMYKKLQTDKENDELWDSLEDKLNRPMILSNVFSMLNIVLFFCFLYDVLLFDYKKTESYGQFITILGIIIFVIATIISIVITALTLNIEKKLNPEKQGNVLDIHVQKVWMQSCGEAERLIAYRAGYKGCLNTNIACMVLIVIAFMYSLAFDTNLTALLFIAIIWFINNLSYLLCAARLERRK